jgi:hypothetical protein
VLDGEWGRDHCGGPYFDHSWSTNPRYKLSLASEGAAFINLSLPDSRFCCSDVDTLAFHVLKCTEYPLRFEKNDVVAKTSYVITNSVSYDGTFSAGDYWLVPSSYVAGKVGRFLLRIFSTAAFVIRHEDIRGHWHEASHAVYLTGSGEYQNGEDNAQFRLTFPGNAATDGSGQSGKVLIKLHTPETEELSLALFLIDNQSGTRVIGPVPESQVISRSKFLISNTVYLECYIPANGHDYTILTCVNPENSTTNIQVTVWSTIQKFNFTPFPMWKKKVIDCEWNASGPYQHATNNPQVELTTSIPNQTFVVRVMVSGCQDPSIVFFVVGNRDRCGEGLKGRIPDERVLARSTYVRFDSVVKDFTVGSVPLNSYLIIPNLLPPGSRGTCRIIVSSLTDEYRVRLLHSSEE